MSALAASVAAASAVCSAAGVTPPATFFVRSQGSLVALYAGLVKANKADKALAATYRAAQAAAAAR